MANLGNLANKYRPATFDDMVEQKLVVNMVRKLCEDKNLNCRNFLFIGPAGTGKAQPLDSKVLTPSGFIEMQDVKIGTEVITHSGDTGKVSGVFPQGERPIYAITLHDECVIRVADNHLNLVCIDGVEHVITTDCLIAQFDRGHTITIPNANLTKWHFDAPSCLEQRHIVDIRYVGNESCQCIYIDHPDHTYVSDGFIPTHNTTTCRIIANVLNEGKGEPIEIDAASNSGVDKMRSIVEQAQTYPIGMNYKIFIIDESHALSSAAWQSALKVLEESPAKSIFLFATTNPEKIPATITSRVQTFQLSKISLDGIINRLKYVIDCENKEGRDITYEDSAISYIAKLANGGMRDALTLLDKALAYSTHITSEGLVEALNLPQYDDYFTLLSAYAKHDNEAIAKIIHTVYNSGVNFVKWFEGFHAFVINIVKYIFMQDIEATMIPAHYAEKVAPYGPKHSLICLKLANKLLKLNAELKTTQYLQEIAITYLCVPKKES